MKRYGYHRASTREQHLDRGIKEITAYCEQNQLELEKVFTDQQTGKTFNRPRYQVLKEDVLRPGDDLIITEVDRLGRNKRETLHVAIREALANCLVNTDYFLPWNVVVEKYPDKIVLANPGTVRLGKKQMLRGGISQPRNRLLLNMFNFIGVGERAGSGVPDIYSIWNSEHFDAPIVDEASGREGNPDRTTLTLPMVESKRKKQAEKASGKNERKRSGR